MPRGNISVVLTTLENSRPPHDQSCFEGKQMQGPIPRPTTADSEAWAENNRRLSLTGRESRELSSQNPPLVFVMRTLQIARTMSVLKEAEYTMTGCVVKMMIRPLKLLTVECTMGEQMSKGILISRVGP